MKSKQSRGEVPPQRPQTKDRGEWQNYWKATGQAWRTEPEIDPARQAYLTHQRVLPSADSQSSYPFLNARLSRADIEWLLAADEGEHGPLVWSDESLPARAGIDLRGADLREENLSGLPLVHLRGGLTIMDELFAVASELNAERDRAGLHAERADLQQAHLEGAHLLGAHLEAARLSKAHLERAHLSKVHLEAASLLGAHLDKTLLSKGQLEGAHLLGADLSGADLREAHLEGASLLGANLEGANLSGAHLEGANLSGARLLRADLSGAHLEGANLSETHLEGANLSEAHLEGKRMSVEDLLPIRWWVEYFPATLPPADLRGAFFDATTKLENVSLGDDRFGAVSLADVHWGGADLTVVDWAAVEQLGDERTTKWGDGINAQRAVVRAYRQLATALQDQGLSEEGDQFTYRARVCNRRVLLQQIKMGRYLFSLFLDLLAGYGYRPMRSVLWYLVVIASFAIGYYQATHVLHAQPYPLAWYEAIILSISSFHGRGFFQPVKNLGDPVAVLASIEAIVGLVIEISFIATFTQRFFGK